jgi:hypothetical protein
MSADVLELSTKAWDILDKALTTGVIELEPNEDGTPNVRIVATDTLMDVAVKLSQAKIKQPRVLSKPEDFNLQKTKV